MLLSPTKIIGYLLIPFDIIVSFKPTDIRYQLPYIWDEVLVRSPEMHIN